jgi:hypothetical protein
MAVVENGIRARDMVMFRMALPPEGTGLTTARSGERRLSS